MKVRSIQCEQTGEIFRSSSEAARHFKIDKSSISRHLRGLPHSSHVGGYTFTYEIKPSATMTKKPKALCYGITPVRCEQTGRVFDSLTKAARSMFMSKGSISKHLSDRENHPNVFGFTFVKLTEDEIRERMSD